MPEKKNTAKSELKPPFASNSRELPATQGMLQLVRTELKADIGELRSEMKSGLSQIDARFSQVDAKFNDMESKFSQIDSRFSQIDSRFNQIDSRFNQVDSRFKQVDSRFDQMDSKFERVLSEVARVGVLVEEQNSNNRVVLEGLTGLWQRQERVECRVDDVEKLVQSIARSKP